MKVDGCTCEHAPGLHMDTLARRGCRLCDCNGVPIEERCPNMSPGWFRGHWKEWHRGHGCNLDDGKGARTAPKEQD